MAQFYGVAKLELAGPTLLLYIPLQRRSLQQRGGHPQEQP